MEEIEKKYGQTIQEIKKSEGKKTEENPEPEKVEEKKD